MRPEQGIRALALIHVEENHDPERYPLCKDRLEEFVEFVGRPLKVNDLPGPRYALGYNPP